MRKFTRKAVFKYCFAWYFNRHQDKELLESLVDVPTDDCVFFRNLIKEFQEYHAEALKILTQLMKKKDGIKQLTQSDLVLLLLGITELKKINTKPVIVINELVTLASDFSLAISPKLINGILASFIQEQQI